MNRTRPFFLVLLAVVGAGAGILLQVILASRGAAAASAPFTLAISLAVIGVLVVVFAVPVRRAVRDRDKHKVDPFYASRVVVLAKASSPRLPSSTTSPSAGVRSPTISAPQVPLTKAFESTTPLRIPYGCLVIS